MSGDPARIGLGFIAVGATFILLPVVGLVSLLDTSIVSNVLALCVDPVEGLVDCLGRVVAVLPDDAVGLLEELVLGGVVPPVGQVARVVVLPALVVEPVGDLDVAFKASPKYGGNFP